MGAGEGARAQAVFYPEVGRWPSGGAAHRNDCPTRCKQSRDL